MLTTNISRSVSVAHKLILLSIIKKILFVKSCFCSYLQVKNLQVYYICHMSRVGQWFLSWLIVKFIWRLYLMDDWAGVACTVGSVVCSWTVRWQSEHWTVPTWRWWRKSERKICSSLEWKWTKWRRWGRKGLWWLSRQSNTGVEKLLMIAWA